MLREISRVGRRTLAAALSPDAVMLGEANLTAKDCIVVGNEGHGLSESVLRACDGAVVIPMMTGVGVESLNAATAASILMWEQTRNERQSI